MAARVSTGCNDRNGREIFVGDRLKWIRDDSFYRSGSKKGQLKQKGAEFDAGTVVAISARSAESTGGHRFWCQARERGKNEKKDDFFFPVPPGLNFMSMLDYIEVVK